jgi:proteasome lid subunit RPN8/RPN11
MMVEQKILDEIKDYAESSLDREICGFVVFSEGEVEFRKCKNVSPDDFQFKIRNRDFLKAKVESKILYVVHSHITSDSQPSELDKQKSDASGYKFLIYSTVSKDFSYYDPKNIISNYIGKIFNIGYNDCFSLVREYFFNEFGINIKDYSRNKFWKSNSPNLIVENYQKEGFVRIDLKELRKHDIIVIKDPKTDVSCHLMIYLGNNEILHHPNNTRSCIQTYSDEYKKLSTFFLRHEQFGNS